jgi:polysaccharide biosynthesis protein PslG
VRRLVTTALTLALLALPAAAFADGTVQIENADYNPATITVSPGSVVTWHYANDLLNPHGVQFGSDMPTCGSAFAPVPDCQKTFPDAGRFSYHDSNCDPSSTPTCITGTVVVYVPPTASYTMSANPQLRGQPVDFDASGSASPGGSITNYSWDFGDSTGGNGVTASHVYTTAGTYTARLIVTDDQGGAAIQDQQVTINVPDSDGDGVNDDVDRCVANPGPAPDGCPLAPPSPIPARIATSATAAAALGVNGAIKSGVNAVLNCSAACNGVFALSFKGHTVALPATAVLPAAGSKLLTLRFTSAAKRMLARAKKPRLILTVAVTDALGRAQTDKRSLLLEPVKTYGKLPAIGISDNQQTTFDDPNFQILKLKFARLVTPWNSIFTERARLDGWLQSARKHGLRPLVSFEHSRGMNCPGKRCKGPSAAQYARAWKAFHKKYAWVKDISPWNEVNSATQPTGKYPATAATYYNIVRAGCRGCTIIAADLLDAPNIRRYATAFLAKAKGKPHLWGLHNYTDTNRFRSRGTQALLQTVRGTVWLTETGGVVRFVTQSGKVALPKSESRAKKAMDYMFRLAEQNAARIKRIYVYQWKVNNAFDRFDAGVVRPNGTPRPSYQVLTLNASIARKR